MTPASGAGAGRADAEVILHSEFREDGIRYNK